MDYRMPLYIQLQDSIIKKIDEIKSAKEERNHSFQEL